MQAFFLLELHMVKDFILLVRSYFIFSILFLAHRAVFWSRFKTANGEYSSAEAVKSWWIGFRFDLRAITIFLLVGIVLFAILRIAFRGNEKFRSIFFRTQAAYFSLGLLFFTLVLWVDIGNYAYLEERLTSKMLALLSSPKIALGMVAESYPVYVLVPLLLILFMLFWFVSKHYILRSEKRDTFFDLDNRYYPVDGLKFFLAFLLMAVCVHSKLSQYPLRWSEAYFSESHFINQFALSPMQNIIDTYKFSKASYEAKDLEKEIELVNQDLGIANQNDLLIRWQEPNPVSELSEIKNVVVIMMESLASFKLGAFGAPLDTSPGFDALAKESLLFENFHVIQSGTAASIFCFITGIPDLNEEETASRNPLVVDQFTMINNFAKKEKLYFIGGDANWGNIRGVIKNNINGVNLLEEKDFKGSSKTDIWGVSDLELFKQANQKLNRQNSPFFAFIQTAGYHRPYSIPSKTDGFKLKDITEKQIADYGFSSKDEFNSLRFADHALGKFFEMAKRSNYYKDTLFVVYADHGLRSTDPVQLSSFYKKHFFSVYHIPFLIHAAALPDDLKGAGDKTLGFEPDILPTIESILGVQGLNTSFGLDLRSEAAQKRSGVFLRGPGALPIRFFDGERIIYTGVEEDTEVTSYRTEEFKSQLKAISEDNFVNENEELSAEVLRKAELGRAYYKVIKYKLKNNQKAKINSFKKNEDSKNLAF